MHALNPLAMNLLAIDPGPEESAYVSWRDGKLGGFGKLGNAELLAMCWRTRAADEDHHMAIEMIASYGMSVGRSVFQTCIWIGRYIEAWGGPYTEVTRHEVKMHLCHTKNSKDSNVREALIDRYGGKTRAIGTSKARGVLHGVTGDVWSALAVAVTWSDARTLALPSRASGLGGA